MRDQRMADVLAAYVANEISREDFWRAMQDFHHILRDYCHVVAHAAPLGRIEITPGDLQIVLENGLRLIWDPDDIRTAPNILVNHGDYEANERLHMRDLIQNCSVAFDIGANIGWYSLHMVRWSKGNGRRVYAFEPVPQTFATLRKNIELNEYTDKISPVNLALGECDGVRHFYVPEFTGSVAASRRPILPLEANRAVECPVTTLDAYVRQHQIDRIDFIKCDVEGSELLVLQGGLQTIQSQRPLLMLEMLRKWSAVYNYHPNDIIRLLQGCGYHCGYYAGERFVELPSMDENCPQTNFYFLHADHHAHLLASC